MKVTNNVKHDTFFLRKYGIYEVYPESEYERILEQSGVLIENKNATILDVGCGTGAFAIRLKRNGFSKVCGIDISSEMIEVARDISTEKKLDIEYKIGSILEIPYPNNSFDIIWGGCILHHLPKDISIIAKELYRILKQRGKVFLFEPHAVSFNSFLSYYIFKQYRAKGERPLLPQKLEGVFREEGFENFKTVVLSRITHKISIYGSIGKIVSKYIFPNKFFIISCYKKAL